MKSKERRSGQELGINSKKRKKRDSNDQVDYREETTAHTHTAAPDKLVQSVKWQRASWVRIRPYYGIIITLHYYIIYIR